MIVALRPGEPNTAGGNRRGPGIRESKRFARFAAARRMRFKRAARRDRAPATGDQAGRAPYAGLSGPCRGFRGVTPPGPSPGRAGRARGSRRRAR